MLGRAAHLSVEKCFASSQYILAECGCVAILDAGIVCFTCTLRTDLSTRQPSVFGALRFNIEGHKYTWNGIFVEENHRSSLNKVKGAIVIHASIDLMILTEEQRSKRSRDLSKRSQESEDVLRHRPAA
jgi:hypothetical protein